MSEKVQLNQIHFITLKINTMISNTSSTKPTAFGHLEHNTTVHNVRSTEQRDKNGNNEGRWGRV